VTNVAQFEAMDADTAACTSTAKSNLNQITSINCASYIPDSIVDASGTGSSTVTSTSSTTGDDAATTDEEVVVVEETASEETPTITEETVSEETVSEETVSDGTATGGTVNGGVRRMLSGAAATTTSSCSTPTNSAFSLSSTFSSIYESVVTAMTSVQLFGDTVPEPVVARASSSATLETIKAGIDANFYTEDKSISTTSTTYDYATCVLSGLIKKLGEDDPLAALIRIDGITPSNLLIVSSIEVQIQSVCRSITTIARDANGVLCN
jgi:hypothetical protein